MKNICFWSVGDGDYACLLQSLVDSFHAAGMEEDFHVFSDRKIEGAVTHKARAFDKRGCFFKFDFLRNEVQELDYHYFIYLDADTLFLKKPPLPLVDLLCGDPLHLFLESDCTLPHTYRTEWWGCPLMEYARLMHECGVAGQHIYNINGGFFIVQKYAINLVCELAMDFLEYAGRQHYALPDEPAWSYALHMLSKIPEQHLLSHYRDVWCSDWEGVFAKKLPDGQPWIFHDYFSYAPYTVNPAMIHTIRSKDLLLSKVIK